VAAAGAFTHNVRRQTGTDEKARGAIMATTETRPDLADTNTGEGDGYSHYARKEEITRAAVEGGTIVALCGFRFSPVRDPQRFPVCPRCKELAAMLWGSE
jgi:Protein of unknown function (DUF3039)